MLIRTRSLWAHRQFVTGSVRREFQSRYRNSLLGGSWTVLQPLTTIFVYTVIFSQIMQSRMQGIDTSFGYSIFLCAGILSWGLFNEIVTRSVNIFLENSNLIKKLSFPHICLPIIIILNSLVNFSIIFGLFFLFLAASRNLNFPTVLAIFPLTLLMTSLAIGLGVTLGILNVFFRDVSHFTGIMLQFGFWITPIIYPISILPSWAHFAVEANPLTSIIIGFQQVILYNKAPEWSNLLYPTTVALVLILLAIHLYVKNSSEMIDEL